MQPDTSTALVETLSSAPGRTTSKAVSSKTSDVIPLSLDQMVAMFDPVNQGVIVFDGQGKLLRQSPQSVKLGLIPTVQDSVTAKDLFEGTVSLAPEGEVWQKILSGQTIRVIHSLDNSVNCYTFHVEVTFQHLVIRSGAYVIAHLRDLTPVQLLEDELAELKELLQVVKDLTGIGVSHWDLDDRSVALCDRTHEILGTDPETFDGTYDAYFAKVHPDDESRVVQNILQQESLVYRIVAEGRTKQVISQLRYILEEGKVRGFVKVILDVTALLQNFSNLKAN